MASKRADGNKDVRVDKEYLYDVMIRSIKDVDESGDDKSIIEANTIANVAGKWIKLAATEIAYGEHIKKGGKIIKVLED
jgi:hypothetical protein